MKWLKIPGYNDKYSISDSGFVRNDKTKRILKFNINGAGYRRVYLSEKGVKKNSFPFVHKLVYTTFITDDIPKGIVIDHIDNNKQNNRLDNLRLLTFKDNLNKKYGRKPNRYQLFTDEQKTEMRKLLDEGVSCRQITKRYEISYPYICSIRREDKWIEYREEM